MKEKSETLIQTKIIRVLQGLGCIAERRVPYEAGMSDIVASIDGKWVAIEVKTDNGHLTPLQALYRDRIIASGNIYAVCRSKEDAVALVEKVRNGSNSKSLSTPV